MNPLSTDKLIGCFQLVFLNHKFTDIAYANSLYNMCFKLQIKLFIQTGPRQILEQRGCEPGTFRFNFGVCCILRWWQFPSNLNLSFLKFRARKTGMSIEKLREKS